MVEPINEGPVERNIIVKGIQNSRHDYRSKESITFSGNFALIHTKVDGKEIIRPINLAATEEIIIG